MLTLEALEIEKKPGCVLACGVLFDYLRETQKDFMPQVEFPKYYDTVDYMKIDEWTARNLELRSSNRWITETLFARRHGRDPLAHGREAPSPLDELSFA